MNERAQREAESLATSLMKEFPSYRVDFVTHLMSELQRRQLAPRAPIVYPPPQETQNG